MVDEEELTKRRADLKSFEIPKSGYLAGAVLNVPVGFERDGASLVLYFTNSGGDVRVDTLKLTLGERTCILAEGDLIIQGGTTINAPQEVEFLFGEELESLFSQMTFDGSSADLICSFEGGRLEGTINPAAPFVVAYPENYVEIEDYLDTSQELDLEAFYSDLMRVWNCNWYFVTLNQLRNLTEDGIRVDIPDTLGKHLVVVLPELSSVLLGAKIPNILDFSLFPSLPWHHSNPYDLCETDVYLLEQQFLGGKKAFWLIG